MTCRGCEYLYRETAWLSFVYYCRLAAFRRLGWQMPEKRPKWCPKEKRGEDEELD